MLMLLMLLLLLVLGMMPMMLRGHAAAMHDAHVRDCAKIVIAAIGAVAKRRLRHMWRLAGGDLMIKILTGEGVGIDLLGLPRLVWWRVCSKVGIVTGIAMDLLAEIRWPWRHLVSRSLEHR